MKNIFPICLLPFAVVVLCCCGGTKTNISIKGKLVKPEQGNITLGRLELNSIQPVDTAQISPEGDFTLHTYENEAALYVVQYHKISIYLVVEPKDKLTITIDNTINPVSYYVEGSADSRLVRELVYEQEKVLNKITDISIAYEKSKENPELFEKRRSEFDSIYDDLLSRHKGFTTDFIYQNSKSLACIFALYQNFGKTSQPLFDRIEDYKIFNFVDSNLSVLYPKTPAVIALNRDVTYSREQLEQKNVSESLFRQGRWAPVFEATTIDTVPISLEKYKGKPVLFFFFAVWNKKSVENIPVVIEIYQKYHSRGLEIVGISFDTSPEKLTNFIANDSITLPIICDYAYWDSKYVKLFGITEIPAFILLDKNHIVSKRDITINELQLTLEEWNKNKMF